MTVSSNTTRNDYTATFQQVSFDYTFQVNDASDLKVFVNSNLKALNTDYTVTNIGNGSGGQINLVTHNDSEGNPIYITGQAVNIFMAMDLDRTVAYQPSGAFLAGDVNNDFDRLWLACNQQQTAINRSLRLPDTEDAAGNMELPSVSSRRGKVLGFHETTGAPIAMATALGNIFVSDVTGLQTALDDKVDDTQVLTNVPSNALFSDTTYTNVSEFNNDQQYIRTSDTIDGGNF